jgi:25S rRNA (uracil2634-N3)-methyltransferase
MCLRRTIGKGITDQDRNILSNQLLILGFLKSASHLLEKGPVPLAQKPRRPKQIEDDASEKEDDEEPAHEVKPTKSRGSVLITLRNHVPYTQWYDVLVSILLVLSSQFDW